MIELKRLLNRSRHSRSRGFTLIEILIVVVILGILAAIIIPQFASAQSAARATAMRSQLGTLYETFGLLFGFILSPYFRNKDIIKDLFFKS